MNSVPFSFKRKVLVWTVLGLSLATGCRSTRKAQRQTAIRTDSASIDRSLEETERSLKDERIRNWEIVRTDYYPLPDSLNGSGSQPAVKSVTTIRRNEQRQRQQNRTIALATEHSAGTTISEQRTENIVPVRPTGRWKYIFYTALLATGVWLIIRYAPEDGRNALNSRTPPTAGSLFRNGLGQTTGRAHDKPCAPSLYFIRRGRKDTVQKQRKASRKSPRLLSTAFPPY